MKKKILLGLSGSVACSKSELFVNKYSENYDFKILSTFNGLKYLSKKFLNTHSVYSDWDDLPGSPHIELARWADEFVIYPASANVISKISTGIADDLLTSTVLMYSKPIYICPAMHEEMFLNTQISSNLTSLSKYHFIAGPRYGNLDIGDKGLGRLIEPNELNDWINKSKGKIICLLDADDYFNPNKLSVLKKNFDQKNHINTIFDLQIGRAHVRTPVTA